MSLYVNGVLKKRKKDTLQCVCQKDALCESGCFSRMQIKQCECLYERMFIHQSQSVFDV